MTRPGTGGASLAWIASIVSALVALLLVGPFAVTLWKSFQQLDPAWPARYGQWVMLRNYRVLFTSEPEFWASAEASGIYVLIGLVQCPVAFFLALWLRYLWPERLPALLVMVLGLPFLVSATLAGLMGRLYFNDQIGVVTRLLHGMGLLPSGDAPLGSVTGTWLTIGVVDAWRWVPFTALLFWLALRALPKRQIEAAQLDGIPWPTALWHVYLPFLAAPVAIVLLLRLLEAFRAHDLPQVLSGGGPGVSTLVASIFAARITFGHQRFGVGAAHLILMEIVAYGLVFLLLSRISQVRRLLGGTG